MRAMKGGWRGKGRDARLRCWWSGGAARRVELVLEGVYKLIPESGKIILAELGSILKTVSHNVSECRHCVAPDAQVASQDFGASFMELLGHSHKL